MLQIRVRATLMLLVGALLVLILTLALLPIAPARGLSAASVRGDALYQTCLSDILGAKLRATPTDVSVSSALTQQFSALSPGSSASGVTVEDLPSRLGAAGAVSYDPKDVRLLAAATDGHDVDIVPVTLRRWTIPTECQHLKSLAGEDGYLELQRLGRGSGPGVCVISGDQFTENGRPVDTPGYISCESAASLHRFYGVVELDAEWANSSSQYLVVPDAVTSVVFGYLTGRHATASADANLVTEPVTGHESTISGVPTVAQVTALVNRYLPTQVTESGAAGVIATYSRPARALALYVASYRFELQVLVAAEGT